MHAIAKRNLVYIIPYRMLVYLYACQLYVKHSKPKLDSKCTLCESFAIRRCHIRLQALPTNHIWTFSTASPQISMKCLPNSTVTAQYILLSFADMRELSVGNIRM